jgi:hypothetical protein
MTQRRWNKSGYFGDPPKEKDIIRQTICQCARKQPTRVSLGPNFSGVELFEVRCLACGRLIP